MKRDTIGRNIRNFRLERALRQEDLAERTGLSTNYIGMVERGDKMPSLETRVSILNALDISADMVLSGVVRASYTVRHCLLDERLQKLSDEDRERIYAVVETLIAYADQT